MKHLLFFGLLALTVSADIPDFPSFDFAHAHCAMQVTYLGKDCKDMFVSLNNLLTEYQQGDPGKGIYAFHDIEINNYFWVTRTTPVRKYVDDIAFEFVDGCDGCSIWARSRSQSLSYYDYSTNFCNMWNPLH